MDRVDLIRIVARDVLEEDRGRAGIRVVDHRPFAGGRGLADVNLLDRLDDGERLDAALEIRALRRSEFRFQPEVDSVNEHGNFD